MDDVGSRFREYARLERKRSKTALTAEELKRWTLLKRLLAQKFSPGLGADQADRRTSVRIPTRLGVKFPSVDDLRGSLMTNMSSGGVFVHTRSLVAIGTRFTLTIHVGDDGSTLDVPVEVVAHNTGPALRGEASGMGLRFLDMTPDVRKRMGELYERSAAEQATPEEKADAGSESDAGQAEQESAKPSAKPRPNAGRHAPDARAPRKRGSENKKEPTKIFGITIGKKS